MQKDNEMVLDITDTDVVRNRLKEMKRMPWLVKESIEFINKILNKDSIVFEFGAGASTIWFAKRAKKVYSFENQLNWFKVVREELDKKKLDNVIMYFGELNEILNNKLCGEGFNDMVHGYQADLILIDHFAPDRFQALRKSVDYLKDGGYIVLDNSNREKKYERALWYMDKKLKWQRAEFYGAGYSQYGRIWKTTIWRKGWI